MQYSGVPALAILAGLVFLSIPWIRKRLYETFYFSHVAMAIVYLALLFWHADNLIDSWAYLWATLALLLAQWLARLFYYTRPLNLRNTWLSGAITTATNLPGGMTSIEISSPSDFKYRPGQHCFLRFPALSLLDNHPFTIASAPPDIISDQKTHELLFMARTHSGFTKKLSTWCTNNPEKALLAWVDGPYGGINRNIESLYDTILLIAGGSGITACLPWIKFVAQAKDSHVTRVVLRWAVKDRSHLTWADETLREVRTLLQQAKEMITLDIQFFITQSNNNAPDDLAIVAKEAEESKSGDEAVTVDSSVASMDSRSLNCVSGRPSLKAIVSEEADRGSKVFVIGCGPEAMRVDLSNAVAAAQSIVFAGKTQEVALHLEAFGM